MLTGNSVGRRLGLAARREEVWTAFGNLSIIIKVSTAHRGKSNLCGLLLLLLLLLLLRLLLPLCL